MGVSRADHASLSCHPQGLPDAETEYLPNAPILRKPRSNGSKRLPNAPPPTIFIQFCWHSFNPYGAVFVDLSEFVVAIELSSIDLVSVHCVV
jgi:hypothetical protein